MHAFGPVTPAVFNIAGAGPLESCLEDDFGLGEIAPIIGEQYVRAFERALLARGVPFAYAGGETLETSTHGASWIVCTTAGGNVNVANAQSNNCLARSMASCSATST